MTDNLVLAQGYDVSGGGSETIDVDTTKYSRIRVIAYAQSGTQAKVKVVVRVTTVTDGGTLGELEPFYVESDGRTSTPVYEIPGPHLQLIVQKIPNEPGNATGVLSVFGDVGMMIKPSTNPGARTAGTSSMGELYVDSNGVLYFCVKSGTPGMWKTVKLEDISTKK
jgi:hypothetical protein